MTPYSSLQGQGVVGFFSESLSEQIFHFLSYMILHTCEGTGGGGGGVTNIQESRIWDSSKFFSYLQKKSDLVTRWSLGIDE